LEYLKEVWNKTFPLGELLFSSPPKGLQFFLKKKSPRFALSEKE